LAPNHWAQALQHLPVQPQVPGSLLQAQARQLGLGRRLGLGLRLGPGLGRAPELRREHWRRQVHWRRQAIRLPVRLVQVALRFLRAARPDRP
jgi:hypothetical protein